MNESFMTFMYINDLLSTKQCHCIFLNKTVWCLPMQWWCGWLLGHCNVVAKVIWVIFLPVAMWLLSGCLLAQVNKKNPPPSLYDILVPRYSSDSSFNFYWIFFFLFYKKKYTIWLLPQVSPDEQSEEVDASCQKSEPVCRFELTDLIENQCMMVTDSDFFSSRPDNMFDIFSWFWNTHCFICHG